MNAKVVSVFIVGLCLVHMAECWTAIEEAKITDESLLAKGYVCQSNNKDVGLLKEGEEKYLSNCSKASCGGDGYIEYVGCGTVGAGPGCVITQDLSKPYPKCCKTVKCKPS